MKDAMWMPTLTAGEEPGVCAAEAMRVTRSHDGTWAVTTVAGVVLAGGMTNAEAWRWVDRASHEPTSRHERFADWFGRKHARGL